jgi:hypothetical protein
MLLLCRREEIKIMGTIKIINLSTLTDCAAVVLVGKYMAGDEYQATHNEDGSQVVNIKKQRYNTYLITDVI